MDHAGFKGEKEKNKGEGGGGGGEIKNRGEGGKKEVNYRSKKSKVQERSCVWKNP